MSFLDFAVPFIVVLGVLIFVHELGHFLAAKAVGVKVECFSLGFGRALLKRTIGETEYRIAWMPLGGYVRMLGEIPGEPPPPPEDLNRTVNRRPIWQRITISAAGPAMNFVLPILLLAGAYLAGVPTPTSRIGSVLPHSPASRSGLLAGDRILSVAGTPTEWWTDVAEALGEAGTAPVTVEVGRRGERVSVTLEPLDRAEERGGYGISPTAPAAVVAVRSPQTPAANAGLRTGDRVTHADGLEVSDWPALLEALEDARGSVELEVSRVLEGGATETLRVTLPIGKGPDLLGRLGILSGDLWVETVESQSPADRAGLKGGDLVVAVGREPVESFSGLAQTIRESEGRALELRVLRDGRTRRLEVVPEKREIVQGGIRENVYAIGVRGGAPGGAELGSRRIGNPICALAMGAAWSGQILVRTFEGIGLLVSGRVGREGLAGPIGIGMIAAESFRAGWVQGVLMMAVISINLAILNLLPIPVLDGGQIMFALLERAKGSELSFRTREIAQQIGITILLLVMVLAFWNDIARHWSQIIGFFQGSS